MDRPFRTLPMRTEPIDGEALDSWLERFAAAARYRTLTVAAEHSWSLSAEEITMSTSTVVMRDRLPPEDAAQWRRMAFNTTEEVVMTEDDPEQPNRDHMDISRRP